MAYLGSRTSWTAPLVTTDGIGHSLDWVVIEHFRILFSTTVPCSNRNTHCSRFILLFRQDVEQDAFICCQRLEIAWGKVWQRWSWFNVYNAAERHRVLCSNSESFTRNSQRVCCHPPNATVSRGSLQSNSSGYSQVRLAGARPNFT